MEDPIVEYQCIPVLAEDSEQDFPESLLLHESCSIGDSLFIFNGISFRDKKNTRIWEFQSQTLRWRETSLDENAELAQNVPCADLLKLPTSDRILVHAIQNKTYVLDQNLEHVDTLYLFDSNEEEASWRVIKFFSAENGVGKIALPRSRIGSKILTITTEQNRNYLVLLPGLSYAEPPEPLGDIWALQLPSPMDSTMQTMENRSKRLSISKCFGDPNVPFSEPGEFSWHRIQIETKDRLMGDNEKSLPGPMACYGADRIAERPGTVAIWGGLDALGEVSGDGWIFSLA